MGELTSVLNQSVVDELKRFPTAELVRLLFPGHPVSRRGLMRSPFRPDHNPSFSCFRGRGGYSLWKDHSTDESGDNISLYRRVFPEFGYVEAVDRLSFLVLGRSAVEGYAGGVKREYREQQARRASYSRTVEPEKESALKVVSEMPSDDPRVPQTIRDYWRGRGIADRTVKSMDLRYVIFENANRKGMTLMDPVSGLPLLDDDGNELKDDGRNSAVGMRNDVGGMVFRVPDTGSHRGFKGCTRSFVSTFPACGAPVSPDVSLDGVGTDMMNYLSYDDASQSLRVNATQAFRPVAPHAVPYAMAFLQDHMNIALGQRDLLNIRAVLSALNAPVVNDVVVVEGMFDALSERELNGSRGDIVVANSIGNLHWAVPFICRHAAVRLMLDNDIVSGAGQKACRQLCNDITEFCRRTGGRVPAIVNGSELFKGYKDLNEALMAGKGFPVKNNTPAVKAAKRQVRRKCGPDI